MAYQIYSSETRRVYHSLGAQAAYDHAIRMAEWVEAIVLKDPPPVDRTMEGEIILRHMRDRYLDDAVYFDSLK